MLSITLSLTLTLTLTPALTLTCQQEVCSDLHRTFPAEQQELAGNNVKTTTGAWCWPYFIKKNSQSAADVKAILTEVFSTASSCFRMALERLLYRSGIQNQGKNGILLGMSVHVGNSGSERSNARARHFQTFHRSLEWIIQCRSSASSQQTTWDLLHRQTRRGIRVCTKHPLNK